MAHRNPLPGEEGHTSLEEEISNNKKIPKVNEDFKDQNPHIDQLVYESSEIADRAIAIIEKFQRDRLNRRREVEDDRRKAQAELAAIDADQHLKQDIVWEELEMLKSMEEEKVAEISGVGDVIKDLSLERSKMNEQLEFTKDEVLLIENAMNENNELLCNVRFRKGQFESELEALRTHLFEKITLCKELDIILDEEEWKKDLAKNITADLEKFSADLKVREEKREQKKQEQKREQKKQEQKQKQEQEKEDNDDEGEGGEEEEQKRKKDSLQIKADELIEQSAEKTRLEKEQASSFFSSKAAAASSSLSSTSTTATVAQYESTIKDLRQEIQVLSYKFSTLKELNDKSSGKYANLRAKFDACRLVLDSFRTSARETSFMTEQGILDEIQELRDEYNDLYIKHYKKMPPASREIKRYDPDRDLEASAQRARAANNSQNLQQEIEQSQFQLRELSMKVVELKSKVASQQKAMELMEQRLMFAEDSEYNGQFSNALKIQTVDAQMRHVIHHAKLQDPVGLKSRISQLEENLENYKMINESMRNEISELKPKLEIAEQNQKEATAETENVGIMVFPEPTADLDVYDVLRRALYEMESSGKYSMANAVSKQSDDNNNNNDDDKNNENENEKVQQQDNTATTENKNNNNNNNDDNVESEETEKNKPTATATTSIPSTTSSTSTTTVTTPKETQVFSEEQAVAMKTSFEFLRTMTQVIDVIQYSDSMEKAMQEVEEWTVENSTQLANIGVVSNPKLLQQLSFKQQQQLQQQYGSGSGASASASAGSNKFNRMLMLSSDTFLTGTGEFASSFHENQNENENNDLKSASSRSLSSSSSSDKTPPKEFADACIETDAPPETTETSMSTEEVLLEDRSTMTLPRPVRSVQINTDPPPIIPTSTTATQVIIDRRHVCLQVQPKMMELAVQSKIEIPTKNKMVSTDPLPVSDGEMQTDPIPPPPPIPTADFDVQVFVPMVDVETEYEPPTPSVTTSSSSSSRSSTKNNGIDVQTQTEDVSIVDASSSPITTNTTEINTYNINNINNNTASNSNKIVDTDSESHRSRDSRPASGLARRPFSSRPSSADLISKIPHRAPSLVYSGRNSNQYNDSTTSVPASPSSPNSALDRPQSATVLLGSFHDNNEITPFLEGIIEAEAEEDEEENDFEGNNEYDENDPNNSTLRSNKSVFSPLKKKKCSTKSNQTSPLNSSLKNKQLQQQQHQETVDTASSPLIPELMQTAHSGIGSPLLMYNSPVDKNLMNTQNRIGSAALSDNSNIKKMSDSGTGTGEGEEGLLEEEEEEDVAAAAARLLLDGQKEKEQRVEQSIYLRLRLTQNALSAAEERALTANERYQLLRQSIASVFGVIPKAVTDHELLTMTTEIVEKKISSSSAANNNNNSATSMFQKIRKRAGINNTNNLRDRFKKAVINAEKYKNFGDYVTEYHERAADLPDPGFGMLFRMMNRRLPHEPREIVTPSPHRDEEAATRFAGWMSADKAYRDGMTDILRKSRQNK